MSNTEAFEQAREYLGAVWSRSSTYHGTDNDTAYFPKGFCRLVGIKAEYTKVDDEERTRAESIFNLAIDPDTQQFCALKLYEMLLAKPLEEWFGLLQSSPSP